MIDKPNIYEANPLYSHYTAVVLKFSPGEVFPTPNLT